MAKAQTVVIALMMLSVEASADSSTTTVAADCRHAVNALMSDEVLAYPSMDAGVRSRLSAGLAERCEEDKWSLNALKCFVYAKERGEFEECLNRLTIGQVQKLSAVLTATQNAGRIAPPGTVGSGWEKLVGASPLETDVVNLCGPIDPPMASRMARDPKSYEGVLSCYTAIEKQALNFQIRNVQASKALDELSARAAADVAQCFTAVQSFPYWHTGFDPDKACAAYDKFIADDSGAVDSGRLPAGTRGGDQLRENIARNRKQQADCLSQGKAALAANQKTRSAAAASAALDVLRDIPPKERTAEESARVDAEIAACKAEATRRRVAELAMAKMGEFADYMCKCKDKACADKVQEGMTQWSYDMAVKGGDEVPEKPSEAMMKKMTEIGRNYAECMTKATTPASTKKGARPAAKLPPECNDYKVAIQAVVKCDKLPQQTRDALKESYEQTSTAWASVPAEGKAALATACKSAADAVKQLDAACN